MSCNIAGIDVQKKVLMVVVASVAEEVADATGAAMEFQCRRFGTGASERNHLVAWLQQHQLHEVVMESTARYRKPVWLDLEPHFGKLHLAQAQSNKAPKGRKNDFRDAKRLARRLLAGGGLRFGGRVRLLGWGMPGQRRERRGEPQLAMPQGEPVRAADPIRGGARGGQKEGQSFSKCIPPIPAQA